MYNAVEYDFEVKNSMESFSKSIKTKSVLVSSEIKLQIDIFQAWVYGTLDLMQSGPNIFSEGWFENTYVFKIVHDRKISFFDWKISFFDWKIRKVDD